MLHKNSHIIARMQQNTHHSEPAPTHNLNLSPIFRRVQKQRHHSNVQPVTSSTYSDLNVPKHLIHKIHHQNIQIDLDRFLNEPDEELEEWDAETQQANQIANQIEYMYRIIRRLANHNTQMQKRPLENEINYMHANMFDNKYDWTPLTDDFELPDDDNDAYKRSELVKHLIRTKSKLIDVNRRVPSSVDRVRMSDTAKQIPEVSLALSRAALQRSDSVRPKTAPDLQHINSLYHQVHDNPQKLSIRDALQKTKMLNQLILRAV